MRSLTLAFWMLLAEVTFIHESHLYKNGFVGSFKFYHHTKFYMPGPSGLFLTAIKPKAKCRSRVSAMLLFTFHIILSQDVCTLFEHVLPRTKPGSSRACVASISYIDTAALCYYWRYELTSKQARWPLVTWRSYQVSWKPTNWFKTISDW
jgi:hypothetical protein